MPLPFDFGGKGVLEFVVVAESSSSSSCSSPSSNPLVQFEWKKEGCFLGFEPTSVLETIRSPSLPTSASTLSSSLVCGGGGGSADTAGVAAVSGNPSQKWQETTTTTSSDAGGESGCGSLDLQPNLPPATQIGAGGGTNAGGGDKCGMGMEDWESVLTESVAASPGQEQSILRWIMGDVEDPSMGLNKLLQSNGPPDFDFNGGAGAGGGFGVIDPVGFGLDPDGPAVVSGGNLMMNPSLPKFTSSIPPPHNPPNPSMFAGFNHHHHPQNSSFECPDVKPPIFNPQMLINQHQAQHQQNPSFFLPLPFAHQDQQQQQHHLLLPPQSKRHNSGGGIPFSDSGQDLYMGRNQNQIQHQGLPHQLQLLPQYLQQQQQQQRPASTGAAMGGVKPKISVAGSGDEMGHNQHQHQQQQQQQQAIIDQLYKAAELVPTGNSLLAQEILARLNHQLSPIGKPFQRAAFYCKEALQLLLHTNGNINHQTPTSPFNLIHKIGAYKSFSEISPFLQFANFTCNQALLEVLEGFDRIHIIDFDIGYGGQWASLMQELALRSSGAPSLRITAFASPSPHDQIELGLTRENLNHFANEINMAFEFEVMSLDSLNSVSWSLPFHVSENEAIAVNLPVGSFPSYQFSLPLILRFVKQLSPKIVVSVGRGGDRTDLPFANHVIHTLQSYSNLLESLDAVNVNLDALQKIERFLLQPGIEKIVMGRYRSSEKTPHWRTLFLSSGFSPLTFSNFTESQAECVVKRTPVRGFHVEKRHSSLVLCWQRKELISASAWRC